MRRLRSADVPVIAITGRPMGWSERFVRAGALATIVAENGAVALFREGDRVCIEYAQDEATRMANAARLRAVAAHIVREVPAATLARRQRRPRH